MRSSSAAESTARHRGWALTLTASLGILLAAACMSVSEEDRFAERVCSSTLASAEEVLHLMRDVQSTRAAPGADSWARLVALTDRGVEITRQHNADTTLIRAPDSPSGKRAKAYLLDYSRLQHARMSTEARRVRGLPKDLTLPLSIQALNELEAALTDVIGFMLSAKDATAHRVPEFGDAFRDTDSCKDLANLGSRPRTD